MSQLPPGQLWVKNVPIAFPAVAEPAAIGDGSPAYGGKLIIDPTNRALVAEIEAAIQLVAETKWKERADDILQLLHEEDLVCFRKKPYRSKKTGKVYEGFEGMYHLGTRSEGTKPTVLDMTGTEVFDKAQKAQLIYSGAIVIAKVEFWAQDNQFGRRINCTLNGVMFAGNGQRFGGGAGPAAASDFKEFAKEPDFGDQDASAADDLV